MGLLLSENFPRRPKMQVTVYTTPSCPQCEMTKKVLTKGNIRFDVVDLSTDDDAMEMVKGMGYVSAPVVIAKEQSWSGFRLGLLEGVIAMIHGEESKTKAQAAA
jgi:glutaredoxin-like protein NrdH